MGGASSFGNQSQKVELASQEPEAPRVGQNDEFRDSVRALPQLKFFCGDCGEKMLGRSQQCVQCDDEERARHGPAVAVASKQPHSTWPTQLPPIRVKLAPQHSSMHASSRYQVAAQLTYPTIDKPKFKLKSFAPEVGTRSQTSRESVQRSSEEQTNVLRGSVPLDDFLADARRAKVHRRVDSLEVIGSRSDTTSSLPMSCSVPASDVCTGGAEGFPMGKITMREFMDPKNHFPVGCLDG